MYQPSIQRPASNIPSSRPWGCNTDLNYIDISKYRNIPVDKMSRGGTTLYVTVSLPKASASSSTELHVHLSLHGEAHLCFSFQDTMYIRALLIQFHTGLRTRHTRSRPSLRIRTVCQPNVDISMNVLECDDPPTPNSSSSSLVLPRRDFAVTSSPTCPRFLPPIHFVDRAVAQ